MKRKLYYWARKHINSENVKFVLLLIPLCVILVNKIKKDGYDFSNFLDTDILVTFIIVALCDVIARIILKFIQKKCEDSAKLTQDYPKLVKKYTVEPLIKYQEKRFPVICLYQRYKGEPINIEIDDNPQQYYQLPSQVADLSQELMSAHKESDIYNQLNIRLQDIDVDETNNKLVLHTARTFYYDSLVTNRACDYELSNKKTVRDIYEPGPYLLPLNRSRMSNHLGFNGFIMTSDDKIPFIWRGNNVSIGKNTLGNSIGASLKAEYAIDSSRDYTMTETLFGKAIIYEIINELALRNDENESHEDCMKRMGMNPEDAVDSIFAVYRDLVECGKPQFLFYMKLNSIDSVEMEKRFVKKNSKKGSDTKEKTEKDGKKIYFFTLEQLKSATIDAGEIIIKDNGEESKYAMMPSASAAIVMLLEYLKSEEEQED